MRTTLTFLLAMVTVGCLAQAQTVPARRILPEDIEQDSIQTVRVATNSFAVKFTYTEPGAKKMLVFESEHAGHEIIIQVGSFERHSTTVPLERRPSGWTEEGWMKRRTDKVVGLTEEDAKKIVDGLRKK